ncbi:MAG TPA: S41 family peptidase [Thermoanaerobaculia bacterium]
MRAGIRKFSVALLWVLLGTSAALAAPANEPPRQLTERGMENLTAFTRLLGYVRFFHPSDQAAAADWDRVAIAGVQEAEKAVNPADLARTLQDFFQPLAPTLRVFETGHAPPVPPELQPPGGNVEVIYWRHRGVELPGNTISTWLSRRDVTPSSLPPPGNPLEVSLGGGVSALLPLTLYRDDGGTIPRVTLPAPSPDKPRGFKPSGNDRPTRLAGVALAWTVFQHFYPYFDVVTADWPAELRRALSSAATDLNERAFVETLRRLMAALDDGHARVTHKSWVLNHQLPLVWAWIGEQLVITHADPRQAPGLAHGDIVLTINNRPAEGVFAAELALAPGATPQQLRARALNMMLLGRKNEPVRLTVRKPDGATRRVTVRRSVSIPLGPSGDFLTEPRPPKVAEVRPGIFYLDMNRIDDADFFAVFDRLASARGIVFDLRGYPWDLSLDPLAHFLSAAGRSSIFNAPLVLRPDRLGLEFVDRGWPFPPLAPLLPTRTVYITDGRAISYAETWLAIVEQYRMAGIVGEATAGTNGTINHVHLPGGYELRFTGLQTLRHDGSRFHGVGVQPTVPVSRTLAGIREGRDEFLEKAIETVSQ